MNILFNQRYGHVDDEASDPNGVEVTLSYWVSEDTYRAPHHYLLCMRAMQDRKMLVDDTDVHVNNGWQSHAEEIRNAILVFDLMVAKLQLMQGAQVNS